MSNTIGCALAAATSLCVLGVAGAASAQDRPGVYLKAEQCLRDSVDRVVANEPNLQSAADFLITYACADQVSRVTKFEFNSLAVRMFGSVSNSAPQAPAGAGKPPAVSFKVDARVDPDTGDIIVPPDKPGDPPNPMANMLRTQMGTAAMQYSQVTSVELRKLAGDLVLAAHERQTRRH